MGGDRTGPSADDAIAVVRLAQRDLALAQHAHGEESPVLDDAEAALDQSLSALDEKRYEEAILTAERAREKMRP
jgi:hypothetical protein